MQENDERGGRLADVSSEHMHTINTLQLHVLVISESQQDVSIHQVVTTCTGD